MSILIKGIDLPKEGEVTFIAIKGKTAIETYKGVNVGYYSATQIPTPHGRIIDESDITVTCYDDEGEGGGYETNAPTILEEEK